MKSTVNSLSRHAYDLILNQILHFDLLPGEAVSDYILAEKLQMSRTPIRDALHKLGTVGLITSVGKKQYVASMTVDDLREIFLLREALETFACSYIIENSLADSTLIQKLQSLSDLYTKNCAAGQYFEAFQSDNQLHSFLINSANISRFSEIFHECSLQLMRFRWLTVVATDRIAHTTQEHQKIISALAANDITGCVAAVRGHIADTRKSYCDILSRFSSDEWIRLIRVLSPQIPEDTAG